jgi:hypothetical protein
MGRFDAGISFSDALIGLAFYLGPVFRRFFFERFRQNN